jgi:hypothetical protein
MACDCHNDQSNSLGKLVAYTRSGSGTRPFLAPLFSPSRFLRNFIIWERLIIAVANRRRMRTNFDVSRMALRPTIALIRLPPLDLANVRKCVITLRTANG